MDEGFKQEVFCNIGGRRICTGGSGFAPASSAKAKDDDTKDNDRIENAGTVVQEILDIPDNIPQDLLDKARCVIVFPSVLKAAFIVGGSYGRGVMTCRTQRLLRAVGRSHDDGSRRR